ncbi:unnamed protein product [Dibothriocephalus latus]|uniref:Uncharacterized protein n=1 Tax=Dibothriocephalus latus TaxID=60516 RepID=A0A3P6SYJ3_DIBLA|nr:unnamed protein product [Dibothriocephalus latus]
MALNRASVRIPLGSRALRQNWRLLVSSAIFADGASTSSRLPTICMEFPIVTCAFDPRWQEDAFSGTRACCSLVFSLIRSTKEHASNQLKDHFDRS